MIAIPTPVLFYDDAGIKLGIREGDQKAALNGTIEADGHVIPINRRIRDE